MLPRCCGGSIEYVDWSNDIFQVTPDQIMDIDKTPLGQVTSDIAALENILSIEHKRIGILQLFFNLRHGLYHYRGRQGNGL